MSSFAADVDREHDRLLERVTDLIDKHGLTDAEAVELLRKDGWTDLADALEDWLDEDDGRQP